MFSKNETYRRKLIAFQNLYEKNNINFGQNPKFFVCSCAIKVSFFDSFLTKLQKRIEKNVYIIIIRIHVRESKCQDFSIIVVSFVDIKNRVYKKGVEKNVKKEKIMSKNSNTLKFSFKRFFCCCKFSCEKKRKKVALGAFFVILRIFFSLSRIYRSLTFFIYNCSMRR